MAAIVAPAEWVAASDNIIELRRLSSQVTGDPVTTATVIATIYDAANNVVTGVTFPVSLTHVGNGTYRAFINETLNVVAGQAIRIEVTATDAGSVRVFNLRLVVQEG
jgi:hypothetical protein